MLFVKNENKFFFQICLQTFNSKINFKNMLQTFFSHCFFFVPIKAFNEKIEKKQKNH